MQIRKQPTIVSSFRIRGFPLQSMNFGVLQSKNQIWNMPTVVGSFRIRNLHSKTHAFWFFAGLYPNTETA